MLRACLLALLFFIVTPFPSFAERALTPGFRTLGVWEVGKRMDIALWYPAMRIPTEVRYNDWTFRAARGAKAIEGSHPLVVLSHDSAGSRFSLHPLAAALARSGFVVASLTHKGDNTDDMSQLFTAEQITGRATELHDLITVLLSSPETAPLIDEQRIGVLGVGPGGTATLLLAGARLDKYGWNAYCHKATPSDPYCTPWTEPLMTDLIAKPHLGKPYRDTRVRAVVAVAPGYGMLLTQKALSGVTPPVLILRADMDTINRAPHHADAIHNALPKQRVPNSLDVLHETDTASLMANCSPAMQQTLPELCAAATPARRERSYTQLSEKSIQFFLTQLGAIASAPRTVEHPLDELNAPAPPKPPKPPVSEAPKTSKNTKNARKTLR